MQSRDTLSGAPLPGFRPSPRGIFIDRWGTLLLQPEGDVQSASELEFQPDAVDALFRAHRAGWSLYLIGNEPAVAYGRVSDEAWEDVQAGIVAHLEDHGVRLRRFYACLDEIDGVQGHARDSVFHLPNTGCFYQASHLDGIVLEKSWVIGDSTLELVAGARAGLRLCGVRTGAAVLDGEFHVEPELVQPDLASAVDTVLQVDGSRLVG